MFLHLTLIPGSQGIASFFGSKPFRLVLPDLGGLYGIIDARFERHGRRLIGPDDDPGTLFIKTAKRTSSDAAYNQTTFYEAWSLTIQRYGISNLYTWSNPTSAATRSPATCGTCSSPIS